MRFYQDLNKIRRESLEYIFPARRVSPTFA